MPTIRLRDALPRPWRELNKRGQILVGFGLIWCAVGYSVLHTPDPAGWEHLPILSQVPREVRAFAWILTGLTAVAFAWRPILIRHDGIGFLALYVMPAERVVIFLWGQIDYFTPPLNVFGWVVLFDGPGYARGLYSAVVWLIILWCVLVTATWDDPPRDIASAADHDRAES